MNTPILSSSSITGTEVVNQKGETLGEIKDMMIDTSNGIITYAVLSFGGFLGLGDKYFGVPFEAFSVNTTTQKFVLNVSKDVLKNAPGFDKKDWPKGTDSAYWNNLYDVYGVNRRPFIENHQYA